MLIELSMSFEAMVRRLSSSQQVVLANGFGQAIVTTPRM